MRCDVLVVGGGPVGAMAASLLSPTLETLVVEEHRSIGEPVQCAGLITPRVVDMASAHDTVLNSIDSVLVHFPGGRTLNLRGAEVKAVVVDRCRFDKCCVDRARKAGATVVTSARCLSVSRDGVGFLARVGEESVSSRALLAADGYRSETARALGLGRAREVVKGIEVDLRIRSEEQNRVQVFLGSDVAPGFFAWSIPCGDITRVGLCITPGPVPPQRYLDSLISRLGWEGVEKARTYSGAIPIGHMGRSYDDGLLVAGDAAGMAKPLSGGGLFTGMTAGAMAAETFKEAFAKGDLSSKALSPYERRWRKAFGRELRNSYRVRQAYIKMKDSDLDKVGRKLESEAAAEVLRTGDIDFPTKLAKPLIRAVPSLLAVSPGLLFRLMGR